MIFLENNLLFLSVIHYQIIRWCFKIYNDVKRIKNDVPD